MNLKKTIIHRACSLGLVLTLAVSLPFFLPADSYGASRFKDVTGHWAEFYISKVYNANVISGYPDGRFWPDKTVTRAEFLTMVNKTFSLRRIDHYEMVGFKDVPLTAWYYEEVSIAMAAGYGEGYSDNTFRPNNPITRQEAAVMLSQLITDGKTKGNLKAFPDARYIDTAAVDAMTKMNAKGYIGAYSDKKIHPRDPLTRAQIAKILSEILDNEDIVTSRTTVDKDKTTLTAKTYVGDVRIDEDLEEGSVTIDNCIILGDLIVEGGGNGTVNLNNTYVSNCIVDKEDSPVRIAAKGDTIVNKLEVREACYLQSSGKDGLGFPDIVVQSSANATLKGNFPKVTIDGSRAVLTLESGEITNLFVTGRYSDIILSGRSEVTEATVDAECYFHGQGTIANLLANADDITYETKPDKMTVGLHYDRPETEGDEDIEVNFRPKHKATRVDVDTQIVITFNTSVKKADGKELKDSDIGNIVQLLMGDDEGTEVNFNATINTAKKIITITPDEDLITGTRYYVIIPEELLINAGDNENDEEWIYFTTEGKAPVTTPAAVTTPPAVNP